MKFLIVDDHPLVRRALTSTIERVDTKADILEADGLLQALECIAAAPDIDLVLFDLHMPGNNGLEGLVRLREAAPKLTVAVISADESADMAFGSLRNGAAGYLPKSLPEDVMRAALGLILAGGVYVPPLIMDRDFSNDSQAPITASARPGNGAESLTPRQMEVLDLVLEGLSNREIANRLDLAEATVKVHMTAILRAYGVSNRAKVVGAARRNPVNRLSMARGN